MTNTSEEEILDIKFTDSKEKLISLLQITEVSNKLNIMSNFSYFKV